MQQIKNSNVSVLFSNILYCFKVKIVKKFNIFTILIIIKILGFLIMGLRRARLKKTVCIPKFTKIIYHSHSTPTTVSDFLMFS